MTLEGKIYLFIDCNFLSTLSLSLANEILFMAINADHFILLMFEMIIMFYRLNQRRGKFSKKKFLSRVNKFHYLRINGGDFQIPTVNFSILN